MSDKIEPIPERWYIRITPENLGLVGGYYNNHCNTQKTYCYTSSRGFPTLSSHNSFNEYIANGKTDNNPSFSGKRSSDLPEITTEQFKKYVMGIEDFPEKWVVERDIDNHEILNDYLNKTYPQYGGAFTRERDYVHSEVVESIYYGPVDYNFHEGFTKITFEQFKEHILKQEVKTMKTYIIKKSELKRIHDIACLEWRDKIEECIKLDNNIFGETVEITEGFIKSAFKAATSTQKSIVEEVFHEYLEDHKDKNAFVVSFDGYTLDDMSIKLFGDANCLMIAEGWAPTPELKGRCLGVGSAYKVETQEHNGRTIIIITKK